MNTAGDGPSEMPFMYVAARPSVTTARPPARVLGRVAAHTPACTRPASRAAVGRSSALSIWAEADGA